MKKKWIIIPGIIILLLIGGYFAINQIIKKRLPKLLGDKVQIEDVTFNLFSKTVTFNTPSFKIDSSDNAPNLKIEAASNILSISGVSIFDLIISKKIGVQNLKIDSLDILITLPKFKATNSEKQEINLFFKEIFTQIEVVQFDLGNCNIIVTKTDAEDTLVVVSGFSLKAEEIIVDTATIQHIFPLEFKKSAVHIDSFQVKVNKNYSLSGSNLDIIDTTLSINNFNLIPANSKKEHFSSRRYEKARLDLSIQSVILRDLLWDIDKHGWLTIKSSMLVISELEFDIFKDKRMPNQPLHTKPLLTNLIKNLPFSVSIDTFQLRKGQIIYEQRPTQYPLSGKIQFSESYLSAYNVTNDSTSITKDPITKIDIITKFMSQGDLNANILLDMTDTKQSYTMSGTLGKLPITYLNQVLAPLTGANATGSLHVMNFNLKGNDFEVKGDLEMQYSDLNIQMLDKKREKEWLASMVGNLILKSKNLKDDSINYKEGEVYFIRYQNKGFFNQVWNGLRVGLMDIVIPFYKNPDLENPPDTPKYKTED